jgi:uncharacterized repeat protein (TIGR03803 family)
MKNFRQQKAIRVVATLALILALAGIAVPAQAQTFTSLHTFGGGQGDPPDGSYPNGLVQGTNGYLYGTTAFGGNGDGGGGDYYGTVFKISTSGTETILDNFNTASAPCCGNNAALALATNGDFYGTLFLNADTEVYKVTPSGTLTGVGDSGLCNTADPPVCGQSPEATLVQASNGDLYGTTQTDGAYGQGVIFKMTLGGAFTILHSFCETENSESDCLDGNGPYTALVQGTNGDLYGATHNGGANGAGTIFQITEAGKFSTLYTFCNVSGCPDGAHPYAALVQGADGNLYGATGTDGTGAFGGGGTFFTITPSGKLTTLYSFCNLTGCADGNYPMALMLATDGNFYGMTAAGGANDLGSIFRMTPSGSLTTEHSFDGTDGIVTSDFPPGPWLIQDTSGTFYGVTPEGGANYQTCATCNGTVFSLSVGLGPFVETLPTSGKVASAVKILGNNLTGATKVTFNGKTATFKVASSTEITTTVPTGATTGVVKVTTSTGTTLTSNVAFQVP